MRFHLRHKNVSAVLAVTSRFIKRPTQRRCAVRLALASLLAVTNVFSGTAVAQPMSLPGSASVGAGGAARYSVPIVIPPGTSDMAPEIALEYNSEIGNGILGLSWTLSGLTSIGRCPRTNATDSTNGGVNYDSNDRFCLDGQRLIAVSGTYGANNTEYRTETESFSKVVSYGATGAGPTYFKVWRKDGQVLELGNTSDSRLAAVGISSIRTWSVNKVTDTKGNYFTVTYTNDTTNGQMYPTRIDYTGNAAASLSTYNSVQFTYNTTRVDAIPQYEAGSMKKTTALLTNIKTYTGVTLVRDYQITYDAGTATRRSRITSIQVCDGSSNCLPATSFGWQGSRDGMSYSSATAPLSVKSGGNQAPATPGDFNQDGITDFLDTLDHYASAYKFVGDVSNGMSAGGNIGGGTPLTEFDSIVITDQNGDGFSDITSTVTRAGDEYFPNASGGSSLSSTVLPVILGDFDGDGRTDNLKPGSSGGTIYRGINTGWSTGTSYAAPSGINNSMALLVGDFDGDGCADILADASTQKIYYSCSPASTSVTVSSINFEDIKAVGDFNGDGLDDLFIDEGYINGTGKLYLATGSGFSAQSSFTVPACSPACEPFAADYDFDGKMDVMYFENSGGGGAAESYIYLSTGTQLTSKATITYPNTAYLTYVPSVSVADWNNDGAADIWFTEIAASGSNPSNQLVHSFAYLPERISTVTTGLGAVTTFHYDRLNKNGTFYTRDSSATYPDRDSVGPRWVVSEFEQDNGIGSTVSLTYSYVGLKLNVDGRGSLGFRQRIVTDERTNIVTTTTYRQDFPYIGLVDTETQVNGSTTLASVTNTYADTNTSGVHFVRLTQRVRTNRDLNNAVLPSITTDFTYDSYGNATVIDTDTTHSAVTSTATVTNTFTNDTTNWVLGQLTASSMQRIVGASNITRSTSFTRQSGTGYLTQVIEPTGLTGDYTLDSFGNRTAIQLSGTGITTRTTNLSYDTSTYKGQFLTGATNALSQSESWAYNAGLGLPTSHTDLNSLTTSWSYDGFGRFTLETRPDGNKTGMAYAFCSGVAGGSASCPTYGAYVVTTTPLASNGSTANGAVIKTYYDTLNRVIAVDTEGFSGANTRVVTEYDSKGRVLRTSRPYFTSGGTVKWTTYTYDDLARPTAVTYPDSSDTTYGYNGLTTTVTDDLSHTTTTVRNKEGLVVTVTDVNSNNTTYTYDAFGNVKTAVDPSGNTNSYTYDTYGRMTDEDDEDRGNWDYTYNVSSQIITVTDAEGTTRTLTYDLLGRKTKDAGSTSLKMENTWVYGTSPASKNVGKLTQAKACDRTSCATVYSDQTFTYDSYGRPSGTTIAVDGTNYTYATTYTSNGQVDTVTYPSAFVAKYVYNSRGYVTDLKDNGTSATLWTADARDAELHLTQDTAGNGVVTYQGFDANTGALTSVQAGPSYAAANLSFAWDTVGNLTSRTDSYQSYTERFCYDNLDRLTNYAIGASCTASGTKTITYSASGNILSKTGVGTYSYPTQASAFPRPHAVKSITGTLNGVTNPFFSYDNNGQMTSGAGRSYTYNDLRMTTRITQGATQIDFTYDAWKKRAKMTKGSDTTYYLYDPGSMLKSEKFVSGGTTTWRDFLFAGGKQVGTRYKTGSTVTWSYFVSDHLGSVHAITDGSGTVTDRLSYDPWGKRRNADGTDATGAISSSTTLGYTGEEMLDAFNLINLNARLYDPELGRFLAADPLSLSGSQSLNRYSYTLNNPLRFIDRTGGLTEDIDVIHYSPPYTQYLSPTSPLSGHGDNLDDRINMYEITHPKRTQDSYWLPEVVDNSALAVERDPNNVERDAYFILISDIYFNTGSRAININDNNLIYRTMKGVFESALAKGSALVKDGVDPDVTAAASTLVKQEAIENGQYFIIESKNEFGYSLLLQVEGTVSSTKTDELGNTVNYERTGIFEYIVPFDFNFVAGSPTLTHQRFIEDAPISGVPNNFDGSAPPFIFLPDGTI